MGRKERKEPTPAPRNLRTMLAEAKDASELMVDLAYTALYFGDGDMADFVEELREELDDLVHDMRAVCVLAARSPKEADAMASVLKVVSSIERFGAAASDIAQIVRHRLGIPRPLVADLAGAEEVSHRVRVREGSPMDQADLIRLELPTETGMTVVAVRRGAREWVTDIMGETVLRSGDVVFLQGLSEGIPEVRRLAGAPEWVPFEADAETGLTDLDRAVDVLVEMKNVSELAVGLAYSALVLRDSGLAAEVSSLQSKLEQMQEALQTWVLRAACEQAAPESLRGLIHLSRSAQEIGDAAAQMVWLLEENEELHPILAIALGEADEVVVRVPVATGSPADGRRLRDLRIETETGFNVLALRRDGRAVYRPRPEFTLVAGDDLIASGPDEGHHLLAEMCGYRLIEDEETGSEELVLADRPQT
jgi:uncharacterized protein with PhoU and TrkA domain